MLPRTRSDLLRVDTVTETKLNVYGARIMGVLKTYWDEVDSKWKKCDRHTTPRLWREESREYISVVAI